MLKVLIIIAIVIVATVVILKKYRQKSSAERIYGYDQNFDFPVDREIKICPQCGGRNTEDALFCGDCGARLTFETNGNVCPYCGLPVKGDDAFCGNCGAPVREAGNRSYDEMDAGEDAWPTMGQYDVENEDDATVLMDDYRAESACLEYFDNGLVQRIHLKKEVTRIGSKDRDTDYVLPSRKVSKLHAQIIRKDGKYMLKDMNSTNGTYLNGSPERVPSEHETELHDGDEIRMADIELVFKC